MDNVCFLCKQIFRPGSMKTTRSRFKIIGITPPEGMGVADRICNNCLHKMYDKQIKQNSESQLKKDLAKDLLRYRKREFSNPPKKIEIEKKKKFLFL